MGRYSVYYQLYACQEDHDGGICTGEPMLAKSSICCIVNPFNPFVCVVTGDWFDYYIRACQQ
ncbi:MAG: hypothetical protein ACYTE8_06520 [Planctomycetota bacterium]